MTETVVERKRTRTAEEVGPDDTFGSRSEEMLDQLKVTKGEPRAASAVEEEDSAAARASESKSGSY